MSEELQDTPGGATRFLVATLAFLFLMWGGDILVDKTDTRQGLGITLCVLGLACAYAAVFWKLFKAQVKGKMMTPITGMIIGALIFVISALWMYLDKTRGNSSGNVANIGSPAPNMTAPPAPVGQGGKGGDTDQANGQGGRNGRSGAEFDPAMQSALQRAELLQRLRQEYIASHDGISPALMAGTESPPDDWVNNRLREMNQTWRVKRQQGGGLQMIDIPAYGEQHVNNNDSAKPNYSVGNVIGSGNIITQGQTGGTNTVNITGPQRAQFTQQIGEQMLADMPDKSKKVLLQTVGNQADQEIGTQIQDFLSKNGYTIERMVIGMYAPPPDHPFTLTPQESQYVLLVVPSTH